MSAIERLRADIDVCTLEELRALSSNIDARLQAAEAKHQLEEVKRVDNKTRAGR